VSKVLIRGGRVIDPYNKTDDLLDILIENGKIAAVEKGIKVEGALIIEAAGKTVTPSLIDMHVHLREPGREDEETIKTGTRAAAKGGFAQILSMPNTEPPADHSAVIEMILEKANEEGVVRVLPAGAVTKGTRGEKLSEMADLAAAGAVAFSDDGNSIMSAEVMRRALEYTKMLDRPLISHCEDRNLSAEGQINEGYYSTLLGLKGVPRSSEEVMVARDLILAEETGGRLHLAHITTRRSVELVRWAKQRGIQVTCEVTPHHFSLTEERVATFDTNLKVNPPLRGKEDVQALKEGLKDGTIDVIASDHAPHARHEKEREFDYAPFGMIGLETMFPLVLTKLVEENVLSLSQAIAKLTVNPAQILNTGSGALSVGQRADITVFDHKAQVKVDPDSFESKSRNSPFKGWKLKGKVTHLLVKGKLILENGMLKAKADNQMINGSGNLAPLAKVKSKG